MMHGRCWRPAGGRSECKDIQAGSLQCGRFPAKCFFPVNDLEFRQLNQPESLNVETGQQLFGEISQRIKRVFFPVVPGMEKGFIAEKISAKQAAVLFPIPFRRRMDSEFPLFLVKTENVECAGTIDDPPGIAAVLVREIAFELLAVLDEKPKTVRPAKTENLDAASFVLDGEPVVQRGFDTCHGLVGDHRRTIAPAKKRLELFGADQIKFRMEIIEYFRVFDQGPKQQVLNRQMFRREHSSFSQMVIQCFHRSFFRQLMKVYRHMLSPK